MSETKDTPRPDVVIVGAGPVGLFTAIQLKLRDPSLNILMLEKYKEYKRQHVLKIEAASLDTGIEDQRIQDLKKNLTGKTPTNRIENAFKSLAGELGVTILYGEHVTDVEALPKRFPSARYIIGAGGRRSIVRAQKFGDALLVNHNVMKVVFCKYRCKGKTERFGWMRSISLMHEADHTINELIGRPKDGVTAVTLQIFVSGNEYKQLGGFTFKNPATPETLRKACPTLSKSLDVWLRARIDEMKEERLDEPKINPVPLDVYQAAKVVKRESVEGKQVTWALVGDAAFGLPFFRALNDGLKSATKLSQSIVKDLHPPDPEPRQTTPSKKSKTMSSIKSSLSVSSAPSDPMQAYEAFFKRMAWWERQLVGSKATSINAGVSSVAASRKVKRSRVRVARKVASGSTSSMSGCAVS
uniref:FAD-binding domain-containing protein n=1 Tax=Lotharella oceanica TaxID=641309 RepID=A0A7S2U5Q7_9EUKA|mmetsp:Transcript_8743/g.17145  ORF Transcript_8743/g.17145 Transcript_8743/m.17145 type:complete len:413 (+) Transcript_8743:63-1301(+)